MKTTVELPTDVLDLAKKVAAKRRTTLKAMIEHSLRRELMMDMDSTSETKDILKMNEHGFPVLNCMDSSPQAAD